jgi:WD40 repeat protein
MVIPWGRSTLTKPILLRATATFDNTIILAEVTSGAILYTLSGHQNLVEDLTFSPDGQMLASASWDRTVKVWDVDTGAVLYTFTGTHSTCNDSPIFS